MGQKAIEKTLTEDFMMLAELLLPIGKIAYDWQPLIAGLLAVLVAVFTVKQLVEQNSIQRKQFDWEKLRAQKVARLRLSHALDELCRYYDECIAAWKRRDAASRPDLPKACVDLVINAAANADEDTFAVLREVVTRTQYFNSRLEREPVNYDVMLADLSILSHWTISLFDYARFEANSVSFEEMMAYDFSKSLQVLKVKRAELDESAIEYLKSCMSDGERFSL